MDLALDVAGIAMATHLFLSWVLQRRLFGRDEILKVLFSRPNKWLIGNSGPLLFRVKLCLPFQELPFDRAALDEVSAAILAGVRVAGLLVPVCLLAFFVFAFIDAGTY